VPDRSSGGIESRPRQAFRHARVDIYLCVEFSRLDGRAACAPDRSSEQPCRVTRPAMTAPKEAEPMTTRTIVHGRGVLRMNWVYRKEGTDKTVLMAVPGGQMSVRPGTGARFSKRRPFGIGRPSRIGPGKSDDGAGRCMLVPQVGVLVALVRYPRDDSRAMLA